MPHTTRPLSPKRWAYLKSLPANTATMVHESAPLVRGVNPFTNQPFVRVAKRDRRFPPSAANSPGITYNVGRNAAKRKAREAARAKRKV